MKRNYSLDKDDNGGILSKNAWLLIILAIIFILYAFFPPVNQAVDSIVGTFFSPLIDMFSLAGDSLKYL